MHLKEGLIIEFKSSFTDEVIETLVAFANSKGGSVYLGLDDDGKPVNNWMLGKETVQNWVNQIKLKTQPSIIPDIDVVTVNGKEVLTLSIQEYPVKPVSFKGRYFKRIKNSNHQMSITEIADVYLKSFNTSWDYYLNNEFKIEDISLEKWLK